MLTIEDKYNFLKRYTKGRSLSLIDKSIKLAYNDVKRTFRYKGNNSNDAVNAASTMIKLFLNQLYALNEVAVDYEENTYRLYRKMHTVAAHLIIDSYNNCGFDCSYGQAQKWINMTQKYIISMSGDLSNTIPYMDIPLDNIIYKTTDSLGIARKNIPWSKLDEKSYKSYQDNIRKYLLAQHVFPMEWEFKTWIKNNPNIEEDKN